MCLKTKQTCLLSWRGNGGAPRCEEGFLVPRISDLRNARAGIFYPQLRAKVKYINFLTVYSLCGNEDGHDSE